MPRQLRRSVYLFGVLLSPLLAYIVSKFLSTMPSTPSEIVTEPSSTALTSHTFNTMAWRSSGSTNEGLIENMVSNGLIASDRVKQAMLAVDRGHYCSYNPYQDSPQTIGWSATISAPHMHANAAESLLPFFHPGANILDIGSGSGYLTHVFANLLGDEGHVVGIDHMQGLVDLANQNMRESEAGKRLLDSGKVKFVKGDGRKGWADGGPYDAIHVGAAAKEMHQDIIDQLKAPGRCFIPVGGFDGQYIYVIDKDKNGKVTKTKEYGVNYVPLTDHDPRVEKDGW